MKTHYMERPYHENLGIGNVCFVYSDDALDNVYEFPIYSGKWRKALERIFEQIPNVKESRVVRCVMARLPPNTEIPTHHDTGKWVTASHRVHVAMRTDSNVGFYAGTDPSNMERYFFPIGLPIELNNHAKHAVRNDSNTMYRIHLMFDYVEKDLDKTRTRVELSNRVIRHRRHIEVVPRTLSIRKSPIERYENLKLFFVIGVMKCGTYQSHRSISYHKRKSFSKNQHSTNTGTSSLYEYICQHPKVVRARTKETHFFDWKWNQHNEVEYIPPESMNVKQLNRVIASSKKTDDDDDEVTMMMRRNMLLSSFQSCKVLEDDTLATGEATPSYVLYVFSILISQA